jgi:hypothetical protein
MPPRSSKCTAVAAPVCHPAIVARWYLAGASAGARGCSPAPGSHAGAQPRVDPVQHPAARPPLPAPPGAGSALVEVQRELRRRGAGSAAAEPGRPNPPVPGGGGGFWRCRHLQPSVAAVQQVVTQGALRRSRTPWRRSGRKQARRSAAPGARARARRCAGPERRVHAWTACAGAGAFGPGALALLTPAFAPSAARWMGHSGRACELRRSPGSAAASQLLAPGRAGPHHPAPPPPPRRASRAAAASAAARASASSCRWRTWAQPAWPRWQAA